jgi:hypothetical protein
MICEVALDLLKRTSEGRLNELEEELASPLFPMDEEGGGAKLAPLLLSMKLLASPSIPMDEEGDGAKLAPLLLSMKLLANGRSPTPRLQSPSEAHLSGIMHAG